MHCGCLRAGSNLPTNVFFEINKFAVDLVLNALLGNIQKISKPDSWNRLFVSFVAEVATT